MAKVTRAVIFASSILLGVLSASPARSQCQIATPVMVAPPTVIAGSANNLASVKSVKDHGYLWTISNGTIDTGQGFHAITFTAGGFGTTTLSVTEYSSATCGSAPVSRAIPVAQAPAWYDAASRTVPIVLTSGGLNGSFFTSELTVANRGNTPVTVDYTYTAAFGGGSGATSDFLPPGQQKIVPDAIAYLQSLGLPIPSSGNRGGTLAARFNNLSAPDAGVLSVRTTTAVAGGRAGLAYPGGATAALLRGSATLSGLRQNGEDRSNVAFVNAGSAADGSITLRPTVFSGDTPASQTLDDVVLAPGQFAQITEILAPLGFANGYVRVDRVAGTAPYQTYAVINDKANSDGSFVPAIPIDAFVGIKSFTLPVVVESTAFSTELILTNAASSSKTVDLTYVADAIQTADNSATVTLEIPAGRQIVLPGFVQYLRGRGAPGVVAPGPTFAGRLFVKVTNGDAQGLAIGARTSSAGGGGRYGLYYVALPNGRGFVDSVWLYGLQQNAENRSNLALVNSGDVDDQPVTFKVEVFDGVSGALVGTMSDVILGPRRWFQIGNILTAAGAGTQAGYVRVTRVSGLNSFVAYAVVNDGGMPGQRTGDGAFLSANALYGRVLSRLTMRISDEARAAYQSNPQDLQAVGATLTPAGIQFPAGIPYGYRVFAGNQSTMIDRDGYFTLDGLPDGTLAVVRDQYGIVRQTFPIAQLLVSEGQLPEPIVVSRLWDGPLFMTEGDSGSADFPPDSSVLGGCCSSEERPEAKGRAFHLPASALPTPCDLFDKKNCTNVTRACKVVPPGCCLDYDGNCPDGNRYNDCALQFAQYLGSTCYKYVNIGCCSNEAAIRAFLDAISPVKLDPGIDCRHTHKGRQCQDLDGPDDFGSRLQLTTGGLVPPKTKSVPTAEYITVNCGETRTITLHNNSCSNESEVTLNGKYARFKFGLFGLGCTAGGTVTPAGIVKHYTGPDGQETPVPDVTLTYTAPANLPDCLTTPVDVVQADSNSVTRYVVITVGCTRVTAVRQDFVASSHTTNYVVNAKTSEAGEVPKYKWELIFPASMPPCGSLTQPSTTGSSNGYNHTSCEGTYESKVKIKVTVTDKKGQSGSCGFCARKWEGRGFVDAAMACTTGSCP